MTKNTKIIQMSLVTIGLLLIFAVYFLYPKMKQDKFLKGSVIEKDIELDEDKSVTKTEDEKSNTFENVKYKGLYDFNKPFTVESETAFILNEDPDVVHMSNMQVILETADGNEWIIISDRGSYNKMTYDCFFEENVKATDGETIILSDNVDLLASRDFASIYNNVDITNKEGSNLKADKIDYDFTTNLYKISMFEEKKVKIKLIQ